MTLFTMALGASGYMQYPPDYVTAASGDYFDVANGTAADPRRDLQLAVQRCLQLAGPGEQHADDHRRPVARGGERARRLLQRHQPGDAERRAHQRPRRGERRTGSSAAATTSNPNVTSGDNFVFSSTFTTQEWDGELVRQQLDLGTGAVSSAIDWWAQGQLDAVTTLSPTNYTTRNIYTFSSTAANKLKLFNWSNLSSTQQAYFTTPAISTLSQFCVSGVTGLAAADQTNASGQTRSIFSGASASTRALRPT